MKLLRIASLWGPVVAYVALLSTLSNQEDLPQVGIGDKVLHVAAFAVLGVLALRALHRGITRLRPGPTLGAVALTVGYGVIDEVQQSFVSGRDASGYDLLADLGGAMLAVLTIALTSRLLEIWRGETPEPGV